METPPYLLLDVDGVLNPFPGPSGSLPPEHRPHRVPYNGNLNVPVWLHPDHGIWLNALHSMDLVRPVWATSWMGKVDRLIGPRLGLSRLGHIGLGAPADVLTRHPNRHLWKREPVAAWAGNEPLVWTDDDFEAHRGGPRDLCAEINRAYRTWEAAGRPCRDRLRVTVPVGGDRRL